MIDTCSVVYRPSEETARRMIEGWRLDTETGEVIGCDLPFDGYQSQESQRFGQVEKWSGKSGALGWFGLQRVRVEGPAGARNVWTLKCERSLPKWVSPEDPCRVLTAMEAQLALQAYDDAIRRACGIDAEVPAQITRLDVYYQHEVGDTRGVIQRLRGAVPPIRARSAATYDTTIMFQGRQRTFRVYDKGEESKDERYRGVLRLEEQVRAGGQVMPRLYSEGLRLNVEECRNLVNERVGQICGKVLDALPVADLMKAGSWRTLFLASHPEQLGVYKSVVSKQAYYKAREEVYECRRQLVGVDLAIPEHAWT